MSPEILLSDEIHFFLPLSRRPTNLSIVWTRRGRRVPTVPMPWQPDLMNPLMGEIQWPVPDNHTISVTLFKDPRTYELEDKDWTFVVEDVSGHSAVYWPTLLLQDMRELMTFQYIDWTILLFCVGESKEASYYRQLDYALYFKQKNRCGRSPISHSFACLDGLTSGCG